MGMPGIKSLLKTNYVFFFGYILFALAGTLLVLFFSKADNFYFLNPYHRTWLNYIFYFFTFCGDGFFCIALAIVFFIFKKRRLGALIITSYALSGIIAQVLKYCLPEARPAAYAGLSQYKNFIKDVTLHGYNSFPSGHAASVFALVSVLVFTYNDNKKSVLLLMGAIVVSYSRIYLGNHFLIDVLAGSFIGILSGMVCWLIAGNKKVMSQ